MKSYYVDCRKKAEREKLVDILLAWGFEYLTPWGNRDVIISCYFPLIIGLEGKKIGTMGNATVAAASVKRHISVDRFYDYFIDFITGTEEICPWEEEMRGRWTSDRWVGMNDEEEDFYRSCEEYKDGQSFQDYQKDICRALMLSSWHYTYDQAISLMKEKGNSDYIRYGYVCRMPANDCMAEVGYICG